MVVHAYPLIFVHIHRYACICIGCNTLVWQSALPDPSLSNRARELLRGGELIGGFIIDLSETTFSKAGLESVDMVNRMSTRTIATRGDDDDEEDDRELAILAMLRRDA